MPFSSHLQLCFSTKSIIPFLFNYLLLLQLPHLNINMYSSQRNSKTKQLTKNKQIKTQKTKLTQPKPKKKKINQKRRQTTTTKRPNN